MGAEPTRGDGRIFTPVFIRLSVTSFLIFATFQGLMAVIAPFMLAHHMTVAEVGETGAVFILTAVAVRPFVGRELDRRGRLLIFWIGVGIIAVAFGFYPWATVLVTLVVLRILHGVGWGMASTASATLVQDVVPATRRGEATGYYANFNDLAMAFGPFLAVFALSRWGFGAFSEASAAAVLLAMALLWKLPEPPLRPHRTETGRLIFPSARLPAMIQLLMNLNFGAVMTFLPVIAVRRHLMFRVAGVDAYGYFYVAYALTLLLARGWLGRLSDRYGRVSVITPGLALLTLSGVLLAWLHSFPWLLVFALVFGLGFGAAQPSVLAWTMERTPPEFRGAASGTYFAAFDLGIGLAALGFGPLAAAASFRAVMLIASGATVAAGLLTATLGKGSRPRSD